MSSSKEEAEKLLEEFEKMLGETDFNPSPIKFPLDEDLEYPGYVNQDADIPPPIPKKEKREPKDGDPIEWHAGHEIVKAQAGNKSYWYCRTCKVEVKKTERYTHNVD